MLIPVEGNYCRHGYAQGRIGFILQRRSGTITSSDEDKLLNKTALTQTLVESGLGAVLNRVKVRSGWEGPKEPPRCVKGTLPNSDIILHRARDTISPSL